MCMQIPHEVQQIMSSERTPVLLGAIPAFEMFMTKWEKIAESDSEQLRHVKPLVEPGLEWATRYYSRMDGTKAYIISMCKSKCTLLNHTNCTYSVLNPVIRMSWIKKHWSEEYIILAESQIKQTVSLSILCFQTKKKLLTYFQDAGIS